MRSILISIKPKWCAKIMNGEKTIEIRKTMPKCDLPIDVYIYCTKSNYFGYISKRYAGKVVAKFTLNKVEKITPDMWSPIKEKEVLNNACLNRFELFDYISTYNGEPDNPFFAWHIDNLVIFVKPKELREFSNCDKYPYTKYIGKAPQNFCYVEVEE